MTDHALFQDDLKAYRDGELALSRRLAVRLHLTHCASCREELTLMTQIAEDLRASEPADALDPTLRAKILGAVPASGTEAPEIDSIRLSRPVLAWTVAGVALAVWFVFYPVYQQNLINARHATGMAMTASAPSMAQESQIKVFKAAPSPKIAVRLSDREAGANAPSIKSFRAGGIPLALNPSADADVPERQVHKEATIGVQVPNPEATGDTVANMVKETGGYVADNTLSTGDDGLKSAELIVKVPVTQFETFLGQVAKLGSVQSKNITGEDITDKTSDANQTESVLEDDVQTSEARLKALGSRAKWHDEQATRDLRIQLAEARARLVLLHRMAALGTITVDLSQTPKPPAPAPVTGGFLNSLKASTHDALQSLLGSAGALLALLIWLLAYAPLWVPALLVGRYALREFRKRQMV